MAGSTSDATETPLNSVDATHVAAIRRAFFLCGIVVVVAAIVLAGWLWESTVLVTILPHFVAAKANAAAGMIMLAAATALTLRPRVPPKRLWLAYGCVLTIAMLAGLTLLEYALHTDFGIDQLLIADHLTGPDPIFPPGRLPPLTAVGFLLVSVSFVAQNNTWRPYPGLSRLLLWLTMLLAFQVLLGYVLDAQFPFSQAFFTQMSLHVAVMFLAICSALLLAQRLLRAQQDEASPFLAADAAFVRRLVAAAVIVPPVMQFLLQLGQSAGYLVDDFGMIVQVVGNSALMLTIINLSLASLRSRALQIKTLEDEGARLKEEQRIAHAAQEGEQRLQIMLEAAFDAVVSIDAQGMVMAWNNKAEKMFGWSKSEAIGQALREMIIPEQQREAHDRGMQRYVTTGAEKLLNREVEVEALRQDGTSFPVRLFITPVAMSGKLSFTAFITDMTARRQAEADLRAAHARAEQAAAAKSQFLAHMSHEIRTPLNGVLGVTDMLLDERLTEPQRQLMQVLQGAGKQLLDIVNDILDFSKIEAGRLELEQVAFNVRDVIDQRMALMHSRAQSKSLDLHCEITDNVPAWVLGDPGRLGQVLLNLVSNAIKFTHRGGVIVGVAPLGDRLRFSVQDTGMGIPVDVRRNLFQPFFQADTSISRRHGGTGLGLTISRQLVECMGGRLDFTSDVDAGSTFWFDLALPPARPPQLGPELTGEPKAATPMPIAGRAPVVLVAEDNDVNRLVVSAQLRKLGCDARVVVNGQQAVEACKNERFDLILMDCHMPELDGFAATGRIRADEAQAHRHTPIVALTASALAEDVERCLKAGMDAHLCKPIRSDTFAAMVKKYVAPPV